MSNRRRAGRVAGVGRRRERGSEGMQALAMTLQTESTWCRADGCEWTASRWYLASQLVEHRLLVVPACEAHWSRADARVCPPGGECAGGEHFAATVDELVDACLGAIAHRAGIGFPIRSDWNAIEVLRPVTA